jgi:hypothetical protein
MAVNQARIAPRTAYLPIRLTGELENQFPDGLLYHWLRYDVVRNWDQPVDEILVGNPATLPLAPQ